MKRDYERNCADVRSNETMQFIPTWVELEDIMLREISQKKKRQTQDISVDISQWVYTWSTKKYLWNLEKITIPSNLKRVLHYRDSRVFVMLISVSLSNPQCL